MDMNHLRTELDQALVERYALSAELNTVNADRYVLQRQVEGLMAENEALLTLSDALIAGVTEVATRPLHRIIPTRLGLNLLGAALAVKNNEHVQSFVAFPKFAASHAATTVSGLWAKVPRVRITVS